MAEPFDDSRAKIENARDHIMRVELGFKDYVEAHPKVTQGGGFGIQTYKFGPTSPLPKKVAMAAGDAIHNLRSALDIMAGDVVQASGKSRKGVHFPFAGDQDGLEGQIKEKHFDRAAQPAIDLLRSMKPYKGGDALLRAVHDLDLTDKHNFIIPTSNRNIVSNIRIGPNITLMNSSSGGNWGSDLRVVGLPMAQIGSIETKLVFAPDQPLAGAEVIPTLHKMAELVSGIVEAFAQLFGAGSNPPTGCPTR